MSDQFDRASELEQHDRDAALAKQQRQSHQNETAFERHGSRYCLTCHCAIAPDRLAVLPAAVRCVDCQQLQESVV